MRSIDLEAYDKQSQRYDLYENEDYVINGTEVMMEHFSIDKMIFPPS